MAVAMTSGRMEDACPACGRKAGWTPPGTINGQPLVRCLGCDEWAQVVEPFADPSETKSRAIHADRPPLDWGAAYRATTLPQRPVTHFRRPADNEP